MNQRAHWRRFVERRRAELHDTYPCAVPTHRHRCPKHRIPVPQTAYVPEAWIERPEGTWRHVHAQTIRLTGICKPCRDELYQQLAAEYINQREENAA